MPEMTPIANQFDPNEGRSQISSLLGIKEQMQALKSATAKAKIDQQDAAENQAVAGAMKDPVASGLANPDGTPTEDAPRKFAALAPTSWQRRMGEWTDAMTKHVEFNSAVNNLDLKERSIIVGAPTLVAVSGGKPEDAIAAIDTTLAGLEGSPEYPKYKKIADAQKNVITASVKAQEGRPPGEVGKEPWRNQLLTLHRAMGLTPEQISGATGVAASSTGFLNTNSGIQPVITKPAIAGGGTEKVGAEIPMGLAPTEKLGYVQGKAGVTGEVEADTSRYSTLMNSAVTARTGIALADQVAALAKQVRTGQLTKDWADKLAVLQQDNPKITARQMLGKYAAQLQSLAISNATTDNERNQINSGMPDPNNMDPTAVGQAAQYLHGHFRLLQERGRNASDHVYKNGIPGLTLNDTQFASQRDPFVYAFKDMTREDKKQFLLERFGPGHSKALDDFEAQVNQK